ncbi:Wzz/FepE/Etk N-terminal domain-containing protein [uncultured Desulfobacter sp.]|uniref:GumC family protein n=1 Tax=uncultured Desulfobacter sp. TaxID=240139 RepID=UPI0029F55389|nr:Wzz/FepE/Etk N-terminal domain-containing protein [uncultured Desulfobacter sp.]
MTDPFQKQRQFRPEQIIDILIRGKWILIIPLCISLTLGVAFTLTADKTYQASTLILVQPPRVPTSYVQSVVSSSITERISTISQQILSRSNLEKIMDQFDLFKDQQDMYLEDKVEMLRERIQVKIEKKHATRRNEEADTFSISFIGNDPKRVMQIANTLASYFMDENLKVREAQAIGTSEFLESELEKTRTMLEKREQKLAEFRGKYLGGLPDELDANLRTMDRLQMELTEKIKLLREVKNTLSFLETKIAQANMLPEEVSPTGNEYEGLTDEQKLEYAKEKYDSLLLTYTAKHPDVQKLKKTIEKLERSIAETDKNTKPGAKDTNSKQNSSVMVMEVQRRQLAGEIEGIQNEIAQLQEKMKIYQHRIEETPKRELELQSLKRDYANIQSTYNSLLDRKLEAQLSVNMEKKQKGEQFKTLDYARLPEKPISPNVRKLFLISVALGFGLGGGIIFLKEFINLSVIRWDDQIEKELRLNILASIPPLEQPDAGKKRKLEWLVFAGFCCYAFIFLAFFAVLYSQGLDRTVSFIKMTLNV